MDRINLRFATIVALIALAAISRVVPHPGNFAPMSAMALFGAAYFSKRMWAMAIPLLATWLSDLFINNVIYGAYYEGFTWFYQGWYWQYGTYALVALMGMLTLQKVTVPRVLGSALGASVLFFLITNLGCWPGNPAYPQNLEGLGLCYAAGLPYFRGTLMGDLFYSGVLFGAFALAQRRFPALRMA